MTEFTPRFSGLQVCVMRLCLNRAENSVVAVDELSRALGAPRTSVQKAVQGLRVRLSRPLPIRCDFIEIDSQFRRVFDRKTAEVTERELAPRPDLPPNRLGRVFGVDRKLRRTPLTPCEHLLLADMARRGGVVHGAAFTGDYGYDEAAFDAAFEGLIRKGWPLRPGAEGWPLRRVWFAGPRPADRILAAGRLLAFKDVVAREWRDWTSAGQPFRMRRRAP